MSTAGYTETLTLFGDPDENVWGIAIGEAPGQWLVAGFDGGPLAAVEPLSASAREPSASTAGGTELLELVQVTGRLVGDTAADDGDDREVELPGVRLAAVSAVKLASVRLLGAWFPAGRQLALSALRPTGAGGQDRDQVEVVAAGEEPETVVDPRLSTTYDQHDAPRRVGVELWLERDGEDGQRPRRLAAEATGASLSVEAGGFAISAYALRCWTGEEAGAGVYLLLRA